MIAPIGTFSLGADALAPRRQNDAAGPGTVVPPLSARPTLPRSDTRLMETMQEARRASALLSTLPGPNLSFFREPPLLPLAEREKAPRATAPILEAELQGRVTSTLLSGLMSAPQRGGPSAVSSFARPMVGAVSGEPLAGVRTAEEIIQILGAAPPGPLNWRIASEAYQMEAQAQHDLEMQQAAGSAPRGEWFA